MSNMQPTPSGWPRVSSSLFYADAERAIAFLVDAFGFEVRLKVQGEAGRIEHAELTYGDGLVMVGSAGRGGHGGPEKENATSPQALGGRYTQALAVFVDDVDAHAAHAEAQGARIVRPLETSDYGEDYWVDRTYGCLDPEGHLFWFMQRLRTGKA